MSNVLMDKLVLGFIADLLYIKGIITHEEFEDIMDISKPFDMNNILEKMLRGEYDELKQGEGYVRAGISI